MCFFFKQKTAYEMRISDWSSDVCSSDLKLACIQAEGNRSVEAEGRIFAVIIVRGGLAALYRTVAHGVHDTEAGDNFTSRVQTDGKIAIGSFFDHFAEHFCSGKKRGKRRPIGGSHFPADRKSTRLNSSH